MSGYLEEKETNYCHTDVNSAYYKNHQLLLGRIDKLEKLNEFVLGHKLGEKNLANRVQDLETSIIELNSQIDDLSDFESKNGERIEKIEEYLKEIKLIYSNPIQQEVWQENITIRLEILEIQMKTIVDKNNQDVNRIKELESIIDVEEIKTLIFNGAQTHASILRCESKIKELELLTNALRDKWNSFCPPALRKEPFRCPVCEGCGKSMNRLVAEPYDQQIKVLVNPDCNSCEGKGIVWS